MSPYDPATWSVWTWFLSFLGVYFLGGFFVYLPRFRRLEAAAADGGEDAVRAYNAALKGWPRSGYAKMVGRTPLAAPAGEEGGAAGPEPAVEDDSTTDSAAR